MGQYYTPIIMRCNSKKAFNCYDFNNGAKLMEHSYIGNNFVESIIKYMLENKKVYNLAWVGDYAEKDDVENELAEKFITYEKNSRKLYTSIPKTSPMENSMQLLFVNHDKKEYVDMTNYVTNAKADDYGLIIHPLPLLTAIGNGKGGGDYRGEKCEDMVGHWACDKIEVTFDNSKLDEYIDISTKVLFEE